MPGYVRLIDHMGSDLSVVNAAKASFAKESQTFSEGDAKLIRYLVRHNHMSPFRHAFVTLEVKAPLMVARQWWKYVVGSDHTMDGWNETSRRYVTMEPEFYVPTVWWKAPESKKQGSGGAVDNKLAEELTASLAAVIQAGEAAYDWALTQGVAPEQARLMLPAYAMYTVWRWSASLQSVAHFLSQRLADDAQSEIREYAAQIEELISPLFPVSFAALAVGDRNPVQ